MKKSKVHQTVRVKVIADTGRSSAPISLTRTPLSPLPHRSDIIDDSVDYIDCVHIISDFVACKEIQLIPTLTYFEENYLEK